MYRAAGLQGRVGSVPKIVDIGGGNPDDTSYDTQGAGYIGLPGVTADPGRAPTDVLVHDQGAEDVAYKYGPVQPDPLPPLIIEGDPLSSSGEPDDYLDPWRVQPPTPTDAPQYPRVMPGEPPLEPWERGIGVSPEVIPGEPFSTPGGELIPPYIPPYDITEEPGPLVPGGPTEPRIGPPGEPPLIPELPGDVLPPDVYFPPGDVIEAGAAMPRMPRIPDFPEGPSTLPRPRMPRGVVRRFPSGIYRGSERGPFGTPEQGEIVIVGRRVPRPPITIGGAGVRMGPVYRGRVIITQPVPLPAPRPAEIPYPTTTPVPQAPPVVIPRPAAPEIPMPTPEPVWSPQPIPLPAPSPGAPPSTSPVPGSAPAPKPATKPGIARPLEPLWAALLRALLNRTGRRSNVILASRLTAPFDTVPEPIATPLPTPIGDAFPVPIGDPFATPSTSPSSSALTGLNPGSLLSPEPQTQRARCRCKKCDEKQRKKKRQCLERGNLVWSSGRKKGKPAGSRCLSFLG